MLRTLDVERGTVDLTRRVLATRDGEIALTGKEAALLAYLAERPGEVVSVDELHTEVWGFAPTVLSRAAYFTAHEALETIGSPVLAAIARLRRGEAHHDGGDVALAEADADADAAIAVLGEVNQTFSGQAWLLECRTAQARGDRVAAGRARSRPSVASATCASAST